MRTLELEDKEKSQKESIKSLEEDYRAVVRGLRKKLQDGRGSLNANIKDT